MASRLWWWSVNPSVSTMCPTTCVSVAGVGSDTFKRLDGCGRGQEGINSFIKEPVSSEECREIVQNPGDGTRRDHFAEFGRFLRNVSLVPSRSKRMYLLCNRSRVCSNFTLSASRFLHHQHLPNVSGIGPTNNSMCISDACISSTVIYRAVGSPDV